MPTTPPKKSRRTARHVKAVNIALQGGGSHGAFTWGVLDRLFEDDRIWVEAISGASAGAMNAVVAAQGMYDGGAKGARLALAQFWKAVSASGQFSPMQRTPAARVQGSWSLDDNPMFQWMNMLQNFASPQQINPFNINPLRSLLSDQVDFAKVRACQDIELFLGATNVETGRSRVFERKEIDADAVLASACLPELFKAVELDGMHYWDGGYTGNPPLYPFFYNSPSDDIVIVQINPIFREGAPKTAAEIQNRVNEITFNSSLMHELRSIDFVSRLLDSGKLDAAEYRRMNIHMIQSRKRMRPLDASSKMNTEWAFLKHLFSIGRDAATRWLADSFDDLGKRSSVDTREMFDGYARLPTHHPDETA